MSRSRRRSGGSRPGNTRIYTPEAEAPEDEPVDIVFEPIEEEQYFTEDEPVPSSYDPEIAEVLDAPPDDTPAHPDTDADGTRADDPDIRTPSASDLSVDPDAESVLDSAEAETMMATVQDNGTVDEDGDPVDAEDVPEDEETEEEG